VVTAIIGTGVADKTELRYPAVTVEDIGVGVADRTELRYPAVTVEEK